MAPLRFLVGLAVVLVMVVIGPLSTSASEEPTADDSVATEIAISDTVVEMSGFDMVVRNPAATGELLHGLDPLMKLGAPVMESQRPTQQLGTYAKNTFWAVCFGQVCEYRRPFEINLYRSEAEGGPLVLKLAQTVYLNAADEFTIEHSSCFIPREWSDAEAQQFTEAYRKAFEERYFNDMPLVARTAPSGHAWEGFSSVVQDCKGRVAMMNVNGRFIEFVFVADPQIAEWLCHASPEPPVEVDEGQGLGLLLLAD